MIFEIIIKGIKGSKTTGSNPTDIAIKDGTIPITIACQIPKKNTDKNKIELTIVDIIFLFFKKYGVQTAKIMKNIKTHIL
ncbi:MAG: hypothetical protein K1060chlam1_00096 [Candidatus Anoxychlamydiales bacterium]|nr:hypothetical protein [Candidatus Anoxychlamydiales bacterium]